MSSEKATMASFKTYTDRLSWFVFFFSVCFCTFLFMIPDQWPRHILIGLIAISVLFSLREIRRPEHLLEIREFFKPWLPWFLGLTILSLYHGLDGFSRYFNALVIPLLLFISLKQIQIKRDTLLSLLACISIVFSILICWDIYKNGGVQTNILGLNKNILIPLNTLSNIACLIALFTYESNLNNKLRALLTGCSFIALCALVLSESRTALLAYLFTLPIVVIYSTQNKKRYAFIFGLVLLTLISLFFLSGRMQEGIADLKLYNAGNTNSSWGIRLVLWEAALESFKSHPIFGLGPNFEVIKMLPDVRHLHNIQHLHSDYFQFLTIGGFLGIISWLSTCILLLIQAKKDPCRLAIIIASLAMGLSEKFWNYWSALIALVVLLTLFYVSQPYDTSSPSKQSLLNK